MTKPNEEKRKHKRYDTDVQIYFHVQYELSTKLEFKVLNTEELKKTYPAVGKNISARGMAFSSEKKLNKFDLLQLDVYIPGSKNPIVMRGEVRWSDTISDPKPGEPKYFSGVELLYVEDVPVEDSVFFDESNKIVWSIVLEKIFGGYRKFIEKQKMSLH